MRKIVLGFITIVMTALLICGCSTDEQATDNKVVKIIDVDLTKEQYAFGVDKANKKLLKEVNNYIKEIKASGEYDKICSKFFGDGKPVAVKSAAYDKSKDQLVIATNAAFEPFEYVNGNDYYGIDMEIMDGLAKKLGKELVIQNMDFEAVCLSVGQHKCDIGASGLTIKDERRKYVNFSDVYYDAAQKVIVSTKNTEFDNCKTANEVEDILRKKDSKTKVGYQNGATGQFYCEGDETWGFDGFSMSTVGYKNGSLAISDLANGNLDYVVLDAAPAIFVIDAINEIQGGSQSKWDRFMKVFREQDGYKKVVEGLKNTLLIAVIGLFIGIIIGVLIATVRVVPKYKLLPRILNAFCSFYVGVFRGTPMVVQLLVCYYVLLPLVGLKLTGVQVSILIFGLNSGAYISEIMRGGIMSVDGGQMEAGRALGLSFSTTMRMIVIPQAVKNILPTLGNEFIALIKETSVVSFVGASDLYVAFSYIGSNSYEFMVPYLVMAAIYIVLVLIISIGIKCMERSFRKSDRRN